MWLLLKEASTAHGLSHGIEPESGELSASSYQFTINIGDEETH